MANITHEHLQHMAKRHHATMQKLETLQARFKGMSKTARSTVETGLGAWLGGTLEGKTAGGSLGPIPYNLLIGAGLLAAGSAGVGGDYSEDIANVGNGFVASYFAAIGYSFGKRWNETGKMFGGGGSPWLAPYENGWPKPPIGLPIAAIPAPTMAGQWPNGTVPGQDPFARVPSPQEMAVIAQRLTAASQSAVS